MVNDIALPVGCITASALRSLGNALDRIASFHKSHGGHVEGTPCLTSVIVEGDLVRARVTSHARTYLLELHRGAWEFR